MQHPRSYNETSFTTFVKFLARNAQNIARLSCYWAGYSIFNRGTDWAIRSGPTGLGFFNRTVATILVRSQRDRDVRWSWAPFLHGRKVAD